MNYFLVVYFLWWCLEIFGDCFFGSLHISYYRFIFVSSWFSSWNIDLFFNNSLNRLYHCLSHDLSSWNHDWNSSKLTLRIDNRFSYFLFSVDRSCYLGLSYYRSFNDFLLNQRLRNDSSCDNWLRDDFSLYFRCRNDFLSLSDLRFWHKSFPGSHHFRVTFNLTDILWLRSVNKFRNLLVILLLLSKIERKESHNNQKLVDFHYYLI